MSTITLDPQGALVVPDVPVIPAIAGDGVGPEIWDTARGVLDAAVAKAYGGARRIDWLAVPAGREASEPLPAETVEALRTHRVAIKGPLASPIGGGHHPSAALRQQLELYACVRPVRWIPGVPSPIRRPEALDVVIFRENTEGSYASPGWRAGSPEAQRLFALLAELGVAAPEEAGIGLTIASRAATERLVRGAMRYAVQSGRGSVTLVHKGDVMRHTQGAFRDWGYGVAEREFGELAVGEADFKADFGGVLPPHKSLVVKDRVADTMFQEILLRPEAHSVIATTNRNGDYLSDACAAQVGGRGLAPGAHLGDGHAVFEATHGCAAKYAGEDKVNPTGLIRAGAMLLRHLGWSEAAERVDAGVAGAIGAKTVTYDLAERMEGATLRRCSAFGEDVIESM